MADRVSSAPATEGNHGSNDERCQHTLASIDCCLATGQRLFCALRVLYQMKLLTSLTCLQLAEDFLAAFRCDDAVTVSKLSRSLDCLPLSSKVGRLELEHGRALLAELEHITAERKTTEHRLVALLLKILHFLSESFLEAVKFRLFDGLFVVALCLLASKFKNLSWLLAWFSDEKPAFPSLLHQ